MNIRNDNGKLTVELVGKVDTDNAHEVEAELNAATRDARDVAIDASGLDYISSAGLRVLLKLRKRLATLSVIEASPDVFEIFEVTDFSQLMDVQKRLRAVSIEGCEVIGTGGNGTVYRLDDDLIVKVFAKPDRALVEREQAFARAAFVSGVAGVIPHYVIRCGDTYGLVFEMVRSDTLSHAFVTHPERMGELVDQCVELAQTLHATPMPKGTLPVVRDLMRSNARNLDRWCTDSEIDTLVSIIDAIPPCDTILHGDLHPNNIMIQDEELVLIDLAEVSVGHTSLDLAAIHRDMITGPKNYPAIAERNLGMPLSMIDEVATRFFATYTGIPDPGALKGYLDQIGLVYALNTVLLFGSGVAGADTYAPATIERLLGPVVLPNKKAISHLIATL